MDSYHFSEFDKGKLSRFLKSCLVTKGSYVLSPWETEASVDN